MVGLGRAAGGGREEEMDRAWIEDGEQTTNDYRRKHWWTCRRLVNNLGRTKGNRSCAVRALFNVHLIVTVSSLRHPSPRRRISRSTISSPRPFARTDRAIAILPSSCTRVHAATPTRQSTHRLVLCLSYLYLPFLRILLHSLISFLISFTYIFASLLFSPLISLLLLLIRTPY